MNRDPQQDPEEGPPPTGRTLEQRSESPDLKDQLEHQKVVIAQFKEMLQKTDQSSIMQEKVDRYASTLSKMTLRAKKSKLKKENSSGSSEKCTMKSGTETPVNEKLSLLRRQLEENKAKLAERGKSQKDVEEMVHQLKAQFEDSLQLIHDTSSNFSMLEPKIDYSKNSSSEELYNILTHKEKKITDLSSKVQKLETMVLDLQENLKEKDCVIDARTKAITLMSESLSKKSKNTQDALDETKEHMRKMQENFIKLENEMKARQMKLLDDLRLKNLEIAELQEVNEKLKSSDENSSQNTGDIEVIMKKQIEDLMLKNDNLETLNTKLKQQNEEGNLVITELKKQIEDFEESNKMQIEEKQKHISELEALVESLKADISSKYAREGETQGTDVEKLKKELEDLNKNMIKVKAEHKKKIKMLNKKIDSFKKIGDLNAQIVKLSEENDVLNERVAELEEEKGNYQLKMMEEMSSKEYGSNLKELEAELLRKTEEIENLRTENKSMREEIQSLQEKLKELSDMQNEKVSSEMSSIQYEEKLQKELEILKTDIAKLNSENIELKDKVEIFMKEKSDLQLKLDQYLQENMELIDKLEKMSTEKVSSAESIEIVENLTVQEKLELEEYQKNLDPQSGRMKMSEEHLEENPDLNDSVNRLTEETSELLHKIELFTVERREVMEKMESLATENSHLSLKLKQVENNSELLTETYEQLQSEKEKLDEKLECLEKANAELKNQICAIKRDNETDEIGIIKGKLHDLEIEYNKLKDNNDDLCKELKVQSELVHEKNQLEVELKEAIGKISDLQSKIAEQLEEIKTYQSVIEENKEYFIKSAEQINEMREIITSKDSEINGYKTEVKNLNTMIDNFNKKIIDLEHECHLGKENERTIENLEKELNDLRIVLDENIGQINDYEKELQENSHLIKQLNQQMKDLSGKNIELQNIMDNRNNEQERIIVVLKNEVEDLHSQIKTKDEMFHTVSSEMKDKFISLQKQTDLNTESLEDIKEPLQKKIEELTNKNSLLMEKMKKIAANLKKKTQNCQELEQNFNSSKEKWETELNEKNVRLEEAEKEIRELKTRTEMYEIEINNLKHVIDHKKENDNMQGQSLPVNREMSLHDELLCSNFVQETFMQQDENKIKELQLIVESQQNDLYAYKDRISSLEEMLSQMDEKKKSLEQKTNELGVQLAEKSQSFEEISKTEDLLEHKLTYLSKHNEEIEKKLEEISANNAKLVNENNKLRESAKKLKQKLIVAQERVNELMVVKEQSAQLDEELDKSKNQIAALEQDIRKLELEKVELQEVAKTDLEKLDSDWQNQFDFVVKEKNELSMLCEKLNEKISEMEESEQILSEKVKDLESKLEQSFQLQESSAFEISSYASEIRTLKEEIDKRDEEIDSHIIEIRNLQSSKQIDMNVVNELKKENDNLKNESIKLTQQLNSIQNQLENAREEVSKLKSINEALQKQNADSAINKDPQDVKLLFSCSNQEIDPFNFIEQHTVQDLQQINLPVETNTATKQAVYGGANTEEELQQKIKTLEFMLKNVESERDELMNQCSHLSNELMGMVYNIDQNTMKKQLNKSLPSSENLQPANEPLCEKKTAYLCYPDEEHKETEPALISVESQIVPEDSAEPMLSELQKIEFTETQDLTDSTNPFLEGPIQRKDAYICYPDESEAQIIEPAYSKLMEASPEHVNIDTFGENDDGWGWSPEEARLEEIQNQKFESDPLRMKIIELEDKIKVLEAESEIKQKEFQELQIKSGKMIKKLKELKAQNETLKKGKKQDDSDMLELENAIQEELKTQIEILEKRMAEVVNDLNKEKNEKQALQKKIETLSTSNQRMIEMKEKQDIEMLMWQRKAEDLKSKLEQFEWGESERTPEKTKNLDKVGEEDILKLQSKITEMTETIKDLTLDNEELQTLLEEQRTLRITAEKAKSVEPIMDNMKTEREYLEIVDQKCIIETELEKVLNEKEVMKNELNRISSLMKTDDEFQAIIKQKEEVEETLRFITAENEKLQKQVDNVIANMRSEEEYKEILNQKKLLEDKLGEITLEKKQLQDDFNLIIKRNDEQNMEFQKLLEDKLNMEKVIKEKDVVLEELMLKSKNIDSEMNSLDMLKKEKEQGEIRVQELLERIDTLEANQGKIMSELDSQISRGNALMEEIKSKNSTIELLQEEKENLLQELNLKENELRNLKLKIDDESSSLKHEVNNQIQNMEHLIQENKNLVSHQQKLEEQIQNISKEIEKKNIEHQTQIDRLNQEWQILVDQRGSDVAESWKLHLDMRETEFGKMEEQLRKEIKDLEEKYVKLVNENNELKRNVDTEIRNEVDQIAVLQQQIIDRQRYIDELTQNLEDKQLHAEFLENQIKENHIKITELKSIIEEKNRILNDLQIVVNTTQNQFDEKCTIVENIVRILEEKSSVPILFDLESISTELRKQLSHVITPDELSNLQTSLIGKDSIIDNLQKELSEKSEAIINCQKSMNDKQTEIEKLKEHIESCNAQEKLNDLNNELRDKEKLLSEMQTNLNAKTKELEESQLFIEKYKLAKEENENSISELTRKLAEREGIISDLNYKLEETRNLKATDDESTQNLLYSLQQCRLECDQLRLTLDEKSSLIDVMNAELEKQHGIHIERETNMEKLKLFVEELQKTHIAEKDMLEKEKNEIISTQQSELNNLRNKLGQTELYQGELRSEKEMAQQSLNILQLQIQEQNNNIMELSSQVESYKKLNDELHQNLADMEDLRKKYDEQNILLNEEEKQMDELKAIIENQVVKIEDLKQKLYEKSNDYDSLIAELDIRKGDSKVIDQEARQPMGQGRLIGPSSSDDLNEWVTRSELDIALYMLHQRDVRCEELTVELTQLLEERDTLQLRLSNALREKEEYKRVMTDVTTLSDTNTDVGSSPSKGAIPKGKVSDIVLSASGAEVATEAQESSMNISENQLENKLSELKNIGYRRDKTLLDEQQQRRLQQLSIMQHHMDEASKLPPEAAARLVDANYTLSRDVQSPSKVLLNWLWGRSTPKVNDL